MIYCIEQNYVSHKREKGNLLPIDAFIFVKDETALLQQPSTFTFKKWDDYKLYGQCELVLRVAKDGEKIAEENAAQFYDAITVGINFTSFDIHDELNGLEVPWEIAKGWPNSSLIGEWLPVANFRDFSDLNFCAYKNREMMQMGNSELMIRNFNQIIHSISLIHTLKKGDIIFTGAPLGISEIYANDAIELFMEDDTVAEFEVE